MEFEVKKMELPTIPEFNFEELKRDLQEKVTKYENIVYNDAEIAQAKKDRADLNKLKKAINDKRIAMEKDYMKPFNEFKDKVKEIIDIIDKPIACIDVQVKEYERQTLEHKKEVIDVLFQSINPYKWLRLDQIYNAKWLNAATSMKSIEEEMKLSFDMIASEMKAVESLEFKEQALKTYMETLSMTRTLEKVALLKEFDAMQEKKPTQEKAVKSDEPKEWMQMEICLNSQDFDEFSAWTKEHGIEWRLK